MEFITVLPSDESLGYFRNVPAGTGMRFGSGYGK